MLRKKRLNSRPIAEINVVPYIDVMLVLLVIFMITAPMLTQGIAVDLPKAASQVLKSSQREPIIVSVNQHGDFFLNINSEPDNPITAHDLMVRVAAELELVRQQNETLPVLVKGDQSALYGAVAEAMNLLKQAGASKVGLMTEPSTHQEIA